MPEAAQASAQRLAALAAAFGYRLHRAGLPVTVERILSFVRSVTLAEPTQVAELYWLGRTTLLTARDQVPVYDRIFHEVFRGLIHVESPWGRQDEQPAPPAPGGTGSDEQVPAGREPVHEVGGAPPRTAQTPQAGTAKQTEQASFLAAVSERERLNERAFSTLTADELAIIARLIEQLPVVPPRRRGRRTRRSRSGSELDIRTTLRRSHRTGGDAVRLTRRARTRKPRRVVLIADVSGSMEPYSRVYLHLMRGAVVSLRAEAFVFATRLTRLSRALRLADADAAYEKVAGEARDWAGGTRIGQSLKDFLDLHGRRGMARGAVVVVVSDGWEIGSAQVLGESMDRLSRLAHRVIWVNPRKAAEDYRPLVGGMAAALPHVDTFVSGHSLHALQDVLTAISGAAVRASAANQTPRTRH